MTPTKALELLAQGCQWLGGCVRSGGALEYVQAGKEIPEILMPGSYLMKVLKHNPDIAAALKELTGRSASNVRPDVVRDAVAMTPRPASMDKLEDRFGPPPGRR